MVSRRAAVSLVLSAALTLVLAVVAGAEDGTLKLATGATVKAPGNQIKGAIQSESPVEVKIGTQTVPVEQIDSLEYDGLTQSYAQAKIRESAGNIPEAADLYGKAAAEAGAAKPLIARDAQFRKARLLANLALADPARATEAIGLLEQFNRQNPTSRQLGPSLDLLARLQIGKGDNDKADKALAELAKIKWAEGRATVLQAKVLAKRGKFDDALGKLETLLANAPEGSDRRRDALLGKAEALAGQKKYEDAEKVVRNVIETAGPEDLEAQATAHNTLGDLYRQAGKPKDALIEFLHTDILYPKDREQHPRALAQIVELCHELKLDDQAKDATDRLKQDYPSSPYATAVGAPK